MDPSGLVGMIAVKPVQSMPRYRRKRRRVLLKSCVLVGPVSSLTAPLRNYCGY